MVLAIYTCSPSGHQVTLMWESVIKFQQMQSSRYGQTLSLQVWLTACSPIVGRLEYGLLSEHAHKHTYVCDSSQTPGTMNNDFCPNNTCYIVLLYVYACEARILLLWHSAQHSAHHYGCNVIDGSSCSLSEPAGLQVLLLLYNTSHTMYGSHCIKMYTHAVNHCTQFPTKRHEVTSSHF